MKMTSKRVTMLLACVLCLSLLSTIAFADRTPYQNTIFGTYSIYIPASMKAEFHVTTRKRVPSVSISATMQVYKDGDWENYSTGISPSFSGTNQTGWDTTANYSSACETGSKYRLVVTYSSSGTSVSCTSNERSY